MWPAFRRTSTHSCARCTELASVLLPVRPSHESTHRAAVPLRQLGRRQFACSANPCSAEHIGITAHRTRVFLPSNSPVPWADGATMAGRRPAIAAAALQACKQLHQASVLFSRWGHRGPADSCRDERRKDGLHPRCTRAVSLQPSFASSPPGLTPSTRSLAWSRQRLRPLLACSPRPLPTCSPRSLVPL